MIKIILIFFMLCFTQLLFSMEKELYYSDKLGKSVEIFSNRIIIKFKPNTSRKKFSISNKKYVTKSIKTVPDIFFYEFQDSIIDIKSKIEELNMNSNIEYAEPDYVFYFHTIPDDENYSSQWYHSSINCTGAWDFTTGDSQIKIAVLDSGIEDTHPDIANNMWINNYEIPGNNIDDDNNGFIDDYKGWDFFYNDSSPRDYQGHGTHVSGITAAVGNNGIMGSGIMWNAKVMNLKCGSDVNKDISAAATVQAIYYAIDKGANVINMSFGGFAESGAIGEALKRAYDSGIVLIASAGNDNSNEKSYPAAYDDVIAVAALYQNNAKASFSNYGDWIGLSAPGTEIYSNWIGGTFRSNQGTSMAAPIVSGTAGLIKSKNQNLTSREIKNSLIVSCENINNTTLGAGKNQCIQSSGLF